MDKRSSFVWTEYRKWRKVALDILRDHVDATVFAELRQNPPRYVVSDDLSWLNEAVARAKGYNIDTKALLVEGLKQRYRFVRAFHACRPVTLDTYYADGILPCDPEIVKAIARSIFADKEGVEKAIEQLGTDVQFSYEEQNDSKVFFCLTEDELVDYCGHYLLEGSEYLQAIAVRVNERQVLRDRGKATLLTCDVPIADIDEDFMLSLAGEILQQIGEGILRRPLGAAGFNFGFWITVPLAQENIVNVSHPTCIPNPHNYGMRED